MTYSLLDSGAELKFERFGPYKIVRPCSQAVWKRALQESAWKEADAVFSREPQSKWHQKTRLPKEWIIEWRGIKFKVMPTDFGHVGLFP